MKIPFLLLLPLITYSQNIIKNFEIYNNSLIVYWNKEFNDSSLTFIPPEINFYNTQNPHTGIFGKKITAENFLYTGVTNSIAVSTDLLKRLKYYSYSDDIVHFILSHEFAHAVQYQFKLTPIIPLQKELQADCLAGAYFKSSGNSLNTAELKRFLSEFGNERGGFRSLFDFQGHGDNITRLTAVLLGYSTGNLKACFNNYDTIRAIQKAREEIDNSN